MSHANILILKGSPRTRGNSSLLADQAAQGARDAGAIVECFDLHSMDIRPCDACDACREGEDGCIIEDDMQKLYPKLLQADGIVIATPIYWFTMSAQTKLFIDRWYALDNPKGNPLSRARFGIILTYGDSDPYSSGAINAIRTFQDAFRFLKAPLVDIVYGSADKAGDIQSQPALLAKAYQLGKTLAGS